MVARVMLSIVTAGLWVRYRVFLGAVHTIATSLVALSLSLGSLIEMAFGFAGAPCPAFHRRYEIRGVEGLRIV